MKISILILILLFFIIYFNFNSNKKENFEQSHNYNKKYKLTIMAIFKNEQDYMLEWLDHHINQGFDHFYLYCNDPNLSKYPYLNDKKYEKYITLIPWTDK
jgi:hypothetical protein